MGLFRFVFVCVSVTLIGFISVLIVGLIFSVWGLSINSFTENLIHFFIIYFGLSKLGLKKGFRNKYDDFPN